MAFVLSDRVRESNVITGTGNVNLGGTLTGYQSFSSVMINASTTWYALVDNIANTWEVGVGTWNTGNTLSRTTVLASSNSGSLVNFAGNTCDCFMDLPATIALKSSVNPIFGSGTDGNVTISSGTTTITRNMNYKNLTISGSGALKLNGYCLFVSGTLDISAAGANAIYGGNINAITVPGVPGNAAGGTGSTGIGGNGGNGSYAWFGYASSGSAGGAGGAGISAAGSAGTVTTIGSYQTWSSINQVPALNLTGNTNGMLQVVVGTSGSGGGAGGGDGTNLGGAGGASAYGGGCSIICAYNINRSGSTTAGCISAKASSNGSNGSNAAAGNAGGGGGGAGGGGGFVWIAVANLLGSTATNCIDVSGSTGGNGGNGQGTGKGGTGGTGGASGFVQIVNVLSNTSTNSTQGTAGTAATVASTVSGTTGGAGATLQVNL